jgi:putative membrane protein
MEGLMERIILYLTILVAIEHIWFMLIEMFLWKRSTARDLLGLSEEEAQITTKLAGNLGLYNGFLAALLMWGYLSNLPDVRLFVVAFMTIAGIYGGITTNKKILLAQALPAGILLLLLMTH